MLVWNRKYYMCKKWRNFWDEFQGAYYIPVKALDPRDIIPSMKWMNCGGIAMERLNPQAFVTELLERGLVDEKTMPEVMRSMRGVASPSSLSPIGYGGPGALTEHSLPPQSKKTAMLQQRKKSNKQKR